MELKSIFGVSAFALALAVPAAAAENQHWTYEGKHGADRWGQLDEKYALCEAGIMQSPIDLGKANAKGLIDVSTDYHSGPLSILNNGHTIQANFAQGSTMTSGDVLFNLLQVHFHTPSEHLVDGQSFPLTAHFVHASEEGKLAVLGIMFIEGAANQELGKLIKAAPTSKADVVTVSGSTFDPAQLIPEKLEVYRYMGSLTTPPCSEGVNWHVVKKPVTASKSQIAAMTKIMGNNARPAQLLNGRLLVAPGR